MSAADWLLLVAQRATIRVLDVVTGLLGWQYSLRRTEWGTSIFVSFVGVKPDPKFVTVQNPGH